MVASRGRTARLTTVYPNAGETKRRLLQTCNESVIEGFGLSRISKADAQNWEQRLIRSHRFRTIRSVAESLGGAFGEFRVQSNEVFGTSEISVQIPHDDLWGADMTSILLSYRRYQIENQRIDFAQVFATAFFRFQFAIANHNRQITDLLQHFPRDLFDRSV
jgi:hypothetical protein